MRVTNSFDPLQMLYFLPILSYFFLLDDWINRMTDVHLAVAFKVVHIDNYLCLFSTVKNLLTYNYVKFWCKVI